MSRDVGDVRVLAAVGALALLLWAAFSFICRLLCWPRTGKFAVAALLLIGAAAAHFIGTYGIFIDKGMARNVVQTDWREATDLLSFRFALDVALRGILPVCPSCRRVRDGRGEWRELESYLREQASSEVRHDLCAQCAAR